MLRPRLIATVVIAAFVAPLAAFGDSIGPDGTPMTRENYPLALVMRPLAAPLGLLQVETDLVQPFRPAPPPGMHYLVNQSLTFSAGISYGFGHAFEILFSGEFGGSDGGSISLIKQFGRLAAVAFRGGYVAQTGPDYDTHTWSGSLGVPLKILIPHVPLAIRGLDTLFYVSHADLVFSTSGILFGDRTSGITTIECELPLWLEFSPLRFITVTGGGTAYVYNKQGTTSNTDGTIGVYGSVYGTFPWVDVGVGVTHYVYLNSNQPLTDVWVHLNLRLWT